MAAEHRAVFSFDRYIDGELMAEGVVIERQDNMADAMKEAARIASRGPDGEAPVLVLRSEALSRKGSVKVKALVSSLLDLRDLIMRGKRCVTDTGPAVKPVIELAAVHILDDAANALEALSALEPPAPESQQDDDRIRREMEEILRRQSERDIPFAPATRPAEQAVTGPLPQDVIDLVIAARIVAFEDQSPEALRALDLASEAFASRVPWDEDPEALKAAMEAGR